MLEAASELVGMKIWPYRQARISLRDQEEGEWRISLFGSDNIEVIEAVDRGEVHLATLNPAAPLTLAYRGCGPFKGPIALRAIAIIPSFDQLAFAVTEKTGPTLLVGCDSVPLPASSLSARPKEPFRSFRVERGVSWSRAFPGGYRFVGRRSAL